MISKMVAPILAFFLLASLCFAADKPVTDDMIHDNVIVKLAGDVIVKGGALTVEVKDGVVTLSGPVENEKQKSRATVIVKKVKGVKQVVNNIQIQDRKTGK
jgi:hyperosmotically inducible protein